MNPIDGNTLFSDLPRSRSLCFTGHRPEKLPRGPALQGLTEALHYYIRYAISVGYTCFFTGLADGTDYYAADYLFRLREQNPAIFVIGVQPCQDYEEFFRRRHYNLSHLREMTQNVNRLAVLPGESRDNGVFLRRNCVMVDHSSAILAVCSDGRSGSMHALNYAKQRHLAYCRLYPSLPDGRIPAPQDWQIEQEGFLS